MARQALGKGLGALISRKQGTESTPINTVAEGDRVILANVADIKASPFQPRRHFDAQQIEELAASIRERGLIQPLVVRKVNGSYELIAGERRLRAVTSLGRTTVKVVVHEATDQEVAELALIENLQRADLSPLEEAEQYRLLQEKFGMKQETIAQHVGKSRAVIANMVRLLDLAPAVREMLDTGNSSMISPVISSVSVATPKRITTRYSLILSVSMSQRRVAVPRHTGKTPSASGSKVPV